MMFWGGGCGSVLFGKPSWCEGVMFCDVTVSLLWKKNMTEKHTWVSVLGNHKVVDGITF